jgi:hypothetical protein
MGEGMGQEHRTGGAKFVTPPARFHKGSYRVLARAIDGFGQTQSAYTMRSILVR